MVAIPTAVTMVHAPACHYCEDARAALAELAVDYPIEVDLVAAEEPRGEALIAEHRAAMFPLVLVDGRYFSSGRLPRRKLRKYLDVRAVA
jgi:glutaredoxin